MKIENKKLYRSKKDRIVGGVCGGIAEYLDIDPTLVRLVWAIAILSGVGLLAYIIAWIIIPENPEEVEVVYEEGEVDDMEEYQKEHRRRGVGIILIVLGAMLLFKNFFPWFGLDKLWPVVIVAIGVWLLTRKE